MVKNLPQIWLEAGFFKNPFLPLHAEELKDSDLPQLYVDAIDSRLLEDTNISGAFVVEDGRGKTMARRHLENRLARQPGFLPVPATWFHWNELSAHGTRVDLFGVSLLRALASKVWELIQRSVDDFLQLGETQRSWFWAFLKAYCNSADCLPYKNDVRQHLKDEIASKHPHPFSLHCSLDEKLQIAATHLKFLGIHIIVFLIDNLGNTWSPQQLSPAIWLERLLNDLQLFRNPSIIWKIFVPASYDTQLFSSRASQTSRILVDEADWQLASYSRFSSNHLLDEFLRNRLLWASNDERGTIADLFVDQIREPDKELVNLAVKYFPRILGPHRSVLLLGQRLTAISSSSQISADQWAKFIETARSTFQVFGMGADSNFESTVGNDLKILALWVVAEPLLKRTGNWRPLDQDLRTLVFDCEEFLRKRIGNNNEEQSADANAPTFWRASEDRSLVREYEFREERTARMHDELRLWRRPVGNTTNVETVTAEALQRFFHNRYDRNELANIYADTDMFGARNRPFAEAFSPNRNLNEIASEIVDWCRTNQALPKALESLIRKLLTLPAI